MAGLIPWLLTGWSAKAWWLPLRVLGALIALIVGQGLLLGRPVLFAYAAVFWAIVAAFVHGYEEPTLTERSGNEYDEYRRAVPAWLPRRTPWA